MDAPATPTLPETPPGRFSRLYSALTGSAFLVREPMAGAERAALREKVVRCLWFDQFLDAESLAVEDGRRLGVFSPGYWNEGAGPDFQNAELAFGDGPRARGDVELHVLASDWQRHGHENDPAYTRVTLHVVLHNDIGKPVVRHAGREIPQLVLERHLSADLDEILRTLDPDGYPRVGCGREGPCARSVRAFGRDDTWVGRFLDIAGDERMLRKARRFGDMIARATPDEVMYEALLETMGYSANRRGFRRLAQAVPLESLRRMVPVDVALAERRVWVQAMLFGAAGFLRGAKTRADAESLALLDALSERWEAAHRGAGVGEVETEAWSLKRTRPTNHPVRRIAGISAFLANCLHDGLCRAMMKAVEEIPASGREGERCRRTIETFRLVLESGPQPYWERRTGFVAPCLTRPTSLLGETRVAEMIVNVIIPLLLAVAREEPPGRCEGRLHNLYCSLRPLADNSVTEYMKTRLFDSPERADRVVRSVRRQQGLLQIFHDYCEGAATTCEHCGFLSAIEAGGI